MPVINRLLARPFAHAFATQDWHPPGHTSFAAPPGRQPYDTIAMPYGQQVLWPDACVQGSPNAALHPRRDQARVEVVMRKGFQPAHRQLLGLLRERPDAPRPGWMAGCGARRLRRMYLAGLATDYCVAWSAEDAVRLGYDVFVIEDACRGIGLPLPGGGDTIAAARAKLAAAGVTWITAADLLA